MKPVFPYRLIKCYGLKRSGNHAIVNWLLPKGNFLFFNNIVPIAPILRNEKALPAPVSYKDWINVRTHLIQRISPLNLRRTTIVGLEDHRLDFTPFFDEPCSTANILILRDPANLFASRIRNASRRKQCKPRKPHNLAYPAELDDAMKGVLELWKVYAREFLGETDILPNRIGVYYNAWFTDQEYRYAICRKLNVGGADAGFATVSNYGGGSSFDQTTYDGQNTEMKVLDRYSQLTDSETDLLNQILADGELKSLADRVEEVICGESA